MSGLAMMYDTLYVKPLEQLVDELELPGMTRLVAQRGMGMTVVSPYIEKSSREEKEQKMNEWRTTYNTPRPTELWMSIVWIGANIILPNRDDPRIQRAYSPVKLILPTTEEETYAELKNRLEQESMRVVRGMEHHNVINAYYFGTLEQEYLLSNNIKACMPIADDSFLAKPARASFIPRWTVNLSLFEINQ